MKEDDEEAAYFRDEFEEREEHTADDDESEARITRLERMPLPQQQKSVWEKDPLRFRLFGEEFSNWVEAWLRSIAWLLFMICVTLVALYLNDLMNAAAGRAMAESAVSGVLFACFIVFCVEILLASMFLEGYFLSFFFWVDIIGTASLVFDIKWLAKGTLSNQQSGVLQIIRAGRAARIGSQLGRITRLIKLLRLFRGSRLLRLFRFMRKREGKEQLSWSMEREHKNPDSSTPVRPTVLGELLAEATTRKCVVIIIATLIFATFTQSQQPDASGYSQLELLSMGLMPVGKFMTDAAYPVLYLRIVNATTGASSTVLDWGGEDSWQDGQLLKVTEECVMYQPDGRILPCGASLNSSAPTNEVWYDITDWVQVDAALNITLTTLILITLLLSAFFFGRDATTFVILPIETMLSYLRRIMNYGQEGGAEDSASIFSGGDEDSKPETSVLATYVMRLVNEIDTARQRAEEERVVADTLLYSMVPRHIAGRLKELRWWEGLDSVGDITIADSYHSVTVLFTDIVGFTSLAARISPEESMRHLNHMYSLFDIITEKHGLYKVETVGDSYMLVGGAPEQRPDHAEAVAAAALEIRATVPLLQEMSGEKSINVRIGMHSGAVTAGVVGFKTASRMESTGLPGEVQLSSSSYELIHHMFDCQPRGKVAVKGKGEMLTYTLVRARTPEEIVASEAQQQGDTWDNDQGTHSRSSSRMSPSKLRSVSNTGSAAGSSLTGRTGMTREALLASPQYQKALERYNTARSALITEEENLLALLKSVEPDPVLLSVVEVDAEGDGTPGTGHLQDTVPSLGAGSRSEGGVAPADSATNRKTSPTGGNQPLPEITNPQPLGMASLPSTVSAPLLGHAKHVVRFKDGVEAKSAAAAAEEGVRGGSGFLGGHGPSNASGKFKKGVGVLVPALAAKLKREEFQRLVFSVENEQLMSPTGSALDPTPAATPASTSAPSRNASGRSSMVWANSDLRRLAAHLHEQLESARQLAAQAAEQRAAARRRDAMVSLYASYVAQPTMPLKDLFTNIVDLLYKAGCDCDVIKLYVVDHVRQVLWPASRGSLHDSGLHPLPLSSTLIGSAATSGRPVRVEDVRGSTLYNPELEELPGGYQTKSLMALPVMLPRDASGAAALTAAQNAAAAEAVHQARDHAGSAVALGYQPGAGNGSSQPGYAHTQPSPTRQSQAASTGGVGPAGGFILGSQGTSPGSTEVPPRSPALQSLSTPGGASPVLAVIVAINRWTAWEDAGEAGVDRSIVPFTQSDEIAMSEAGECVAALLARRRSEILLTATGAGLGGGTAGTRRWGVAGSTSRSTAAGGSAIASVPPSVLEARVRGIEHNSPQVLFDIGGLNLWALRVEEVMGVARDLLMGFYPGVMARLGLGREAVEASVVSFLGQVAALYQPRAFFNLAHSVSVLQGIYVTHIACGGLDALFGDTELLALLLSSLLLNLLPQPHLVDPHSIGSLSHPSQPGGNLKRAVLGVVSAKALTAGGLSEGGLNSPSAAGAASADTPLFRHGQQQQHHQGAYTRSKTASTGLPPTPAAPGSRTKAGSTAAGGGAAAGAENGAESVQATQGSIVERTSDTASQAAAVPALHSGGPSFVRQLSNMMGVVRGSVVGVLDGGRTSAGFRRPSNTSTTGAPSVNASSVGLVALRAPHAPCQTDDASTTDRATPGGRTSTSSSTAGTGRRSDILNPHFGRASVDAGGGGNERPVSLDSRSPARTSVPMTATAASGGGGMPHALPHVRRPSPSHPALLPASTEGTPSPPPAPAGSPPTGGPSPTKARAMHPPSLNLADIVNAAGQDSPAPAGWANSPLLPLPGTQQPKALGTTSASTTTGARNSATSATVGAANMNSASNAGGANTPTPPRSRRASTTEPGGAPSEGHPSGNHLVTISGLGNNSVPGAAGAARSPAGVVGVRRAEDVAALVEQVLGQAAGPHGLLSGLEPGAASAVKVAVIDLLMAQPPTPPAYSDVASAIAAAATANAQLARKSPKNAAPTSHHQQRGAGTGVAASPFAAVSPRMASVTGRQGSVVLMAKLLQGQQGTHQGRPDQVAAVAAAVAAQGGAHVAQPAHANEMLAHGLTAHELLSELQHDSDGFTAGQTAVASVLLQAWSEQLPLKSTAVAMQLLTARAQDLGVTLPSSGALHGLAPAGQAHAHAAGVVQGGVGKGGKHPSALDLMAWSVSQSGGAPEGAAGATQVRRSPPSLAGQLPTSSSTGGYAGTAGTTAGTPTASAAAGRTVASSGPSMSALGMGFVRGFLGIGSHSHHQKASSPPAAQGQGGSASGGTLGGVPAQLMQQLVVAELARMKAEVYPVWSRLAQLFPALDSIFVSHIVTAPERWEAELPALIMGRASSAAQHGHPHPQTAAAAFGAGVAPSPSPPPGSSIPGGVAAALNAGGSGTTPGGGTAFGGTIQFGGGTQPPPLAPGSSSQVLINALAAHTQQLAHSQQQQGDALGLRPRVSRPTPTLVMPGNNTLGTPFGTGSGTLGPATVSTQAVQNAVQSGTAGTVGGTTPAVPGTQAGLRSPSPSVPLPAVITAGITPGVTPKGVTWASSLGDDPRLLRKATTLTERSQQHGSVTILEEGESSIASAMGSVDGRPADGSTGQGSNAGTEEDGSSTPRALQHRKSRSAISSSAAGSAVLAPADISLALQSQCNDTPAAPPGAPTSSTSMYPTPTPQHQQQQVPQNQHSQPQPQQQALQRQSSQQSQTGTPPLPLSRFYRPGHGSARARSGHLLPPGQMPPGLGGGASNSSDGAAAAGAGASSSYTAPGSPRGSVPEGSIPDTLSSVAGTQRYSTAAGGGASGTGTEQRYNLFFSGNSSSTGSSERNTGGVGGGGGGAVALHLNSTGQGGSGGLPGAAGLDSDNNLGIRRASAPEHGDHTHANPSELRSGRDHPQQQPAGLPNSTSGEAQQDRSHQESGDTSSRVLQTSTSYVGRLNRFQQGASPPAQDTGTPPDEAVGGVSHSDAHSPPAPKPRPPAHTKAHRPPSLELPLPPSGAPSGLPTSARLLQSQSTRQAEPQPELQSQSLGQQPGQLTAAGTPSGQGGDDEEVEVGASLPDAGGSFMFASETASGRLDAGMVETPRAPYLISPSVQAIPGEPRMQETPAAAGQVQGNDGGGGGDDEEEAGMLPTLTMPLQQHPQRGQGH